MEIDLENTTVEELIELIEKENKNFKKVYKPIVEVKETYKYLRYKDDNGEFEFTDVRFKDCIKNPYRYGAKIYFSNRIEEYSAPTLKELNKKIPIHISCNKIYNGGKV